MNERSIERKGVLHEANRRGTTHSSKGTRKVQADSNTGSKNLGKGRVRKEGRNRETRKKTAVASKAVEKQTLLAVGGEAHKACSTAQIQWGETRGEGSYSAGVVSEVTKTSQDQGPREEGVQGQDGTPAAERNCTSAPVKRTPHIRQAPSPAQMGGNSR